MGKRKATMSKENMEFLNKIKHPDFQFERPWFYNNEYSLRCELGVGNNDEFVDNAYKRAVEIFDIIFCDKPDLYFFDEYICESNDFGCGLKVTAEIIEDRVALYKQQLEDLAELLTFDYEVIKGVKIGLSISENVIRRNRYFVFPTKKEINFKKLIKTQLANSSYLLHFVSLENECIYSIYDDRGLDIVFTSKEKGKPFYEKLKPYLLQYGIEKMKDTFE